MFILLLFYLNNDILVKLNFELNGGGIMSRVCSVCNKGRASGNNVSHSNRKTKRAFNANVQKVRIVTESGVSNEYVCARCLKSGKVERA